MKAQSVYVNNQDVHSSEVRGFETIDAIHWQQEGFASRAPAGSRALRVIMEGDGGGNNSTILAHRRNGALPVSLAAGECLVYNAAAESYLHMKADGSIDVKSGNSTINILQSNVNVMEGTVTVTGGDVIADGISLKEHVHPQNSGNHFGGGTDTSPPKE